MVEQIIFTIIILITAAGFAVAALVKKNPLYKGKRGEKLVSSIIGHTVQDRQYVINNLILAADGKSSQIDHVAINSHGVFVIETKNYSGRIYGSKEQSEWTQVLAYGKVKNKLYNPIKQNAAHIVKIKKIVGNVPIHSVIVFVQNNTRFIKADNVIPLKMLKSTLERGEDILSAQQMKDIFATLMTHKEDISSRQHVQNIIKMQNDLDSGICPRCGGKLVLRHGKYGDFFGCEHYPECRFIKKYQMPFCGAAVTFSY